jgi:hypothetical protein
MIQEVYFTIKNRTTNSGANPVVGRVWTALAVLAGAMSVHQNAFADNDDRYFCIFKRENSSYQVVDAYPTTARSEQWACFDAEKQCRRNLRSGQVCSLYSSGEFGWIETEERLYCASRNGGSSTCYLKGPALSSGRLIEQVSRGTCTQGTNWGVNEGRDTMWVNNGCRGVFGVDVRYYQEPDAPPRIEAPDSPDHR